MFVKMSQKQSLIKDAQLDCHISVQSLQIKVLTPTL